jgi:hypothetical protein
VVQRLLHSPTVRVRQLAAEPGGDQYAALLRELFDLEVPQTSQVNTVPDIAPGWSADVASSRSPGSGPGLFPDITRGPQPGGDR